MKSFISTLALIVALAATLTSAPALGAETKYFHLNTNPENPTRQPDWRTEEGVVLSKDSPVITIGGGGGKESTGKLPAGALVIIDRSSGEALWVAICGNTHRLPKGWKPEGKKILFGIVGSYERACEEMKEVLLRLEKLQEGIDALLARPLSVTSSEVRTIVREELKPFTPPPDRFNGWCGFWTNTGCTVLAGVVVGGTVYIATRDKGDDGVPPDTDTGGAFLRTGITPRIGFIPPSHGRGGGGFIGASIGW
ncbi:MAG: hypothetical protein WCT22_05560 [Patescibacteria group bacterium]